jgi:hypothetical protein
VAKGCGVSRIDLVASAVGVITRATNAEIALAVFDFLASTVLVRPTTRCLPEHRDLCKDSVSDSILLRRTCDELEHDLLKHHADTTVHVVECEILLVPSGQQVLGSNFSIAHVRTTTGRRGTRIESMYILDEFGGPGDGHPVMDTVVALATPGLFVGALSWTT